MGAAGTGVAAAGLLLALALPGGVIMSFAGLFMLVLGAALMTPLVIRVLHRLLARAGLPGIWRMGVRDLDRHLSRLGIAVAALMVALSASVGVGVMVESMRASVNTWLSDLLSADLYVAAEGFEEGATLPADVVEAVSAWTAWPPSAVTASARCRWPGGVWKSSVRSCAPSRQGFALSVARRRHGSNLLVRCWFPNRWPSTSAWHPDRHWSCRRRRATGCPSGRCIP